jgi:hypothetical protein
MKTRALYISIAVGLGVVTAFNVFVAIGMDSVAALTLRQLRAQKHIDILCLGNSLMAAGLNVKTFEAAWPGTPPPPVVANAALGSSETVEHYLLAHETFLHHEEIRTVVYGFFDFQLTDPPPFGWQDLIWNRAMVYTTDPDTAAALFAPGSASVKWRLRLTAWMPMLRERTHIWRYVELFRRSLGSLGLPPAENDQFGRVADFQEFMHDQEAHFQKTCAEKLAHSPDIVRPIEALIRLAHSHGARVVIVEMPLPSAHRKYCYSTPAWQEYRKYLQQKLAAEEVTYIDADDWESDSRFNDGLHLNGIGAKEFSTRLAQTLAAEEDHRK